jgi:cobalt-zinc-cadmium resistance protein CzcA
LEVGYNNQSLIGWQTAQNGTEKYYDASNRFSTAQVGVSIPILGKASKAKVNAAMAREKVVEKSAEINRFRLLAQYQELWKARANLQQQVANYEQEILPGADRIIQLARKQLLEGELNYVNWLVLAEPSTKMPLMYYQKLRELQLNDAQLAYYSEIN